MSDTTPTTEEVRDFVTQIYGNDSSLARARAEAVGLWFDKWLAEHDRELSERVWDEGSSDGAWNSEHRSLIERTLREAIENPYRQGETE